MRILVCGSRHLSSHDTAAAIDARLRQVPGFPTVIHGGAQGVDQTAGAVAVTLQCPVEVYPADWLLGRRAGPLRHQTMLDSKPDLVLAFHTDPALGRGTADMVRRARAAGVPVEVHLL